MKISAPVYSLRAHGWFGGDMYHRLGVVFWPYPIGVFNRYLIQSIYYSPRGWIYQRRRTWHGPVWAAQKPSIPYNRRTPYQQFYRHVFASGITRWQGFSNLTKDVYRKLKFPKQASGFNRWLHYWLDDRRNKDFQKSSL